jgi:hypothetical protein
MNCIAVFKILVEEAPASKILIPLFLIMLFGYSLFFMLVLQKFAAHITVTRLLLWGGGIVSGQGCTGSERERRNALCN